MTTKQFDLKTITAEQVRDMLESIFLDSTTPPELPEPDETDTTPGNDNPYVWEPTPPADDDDDIEDSCDMYFGGIDDES